MSFCALGFGVHSSTTDFTCTLSIIAGSSILTLAQPEHVSAIQQALAQCAMGTASTVRYRIRSKRGYSDVVTREQIDRIAVSKARADFFPSSGFYPRNIDEPDDLMQPASGPQHINIMYVISSRLPRTQFSPGSTLQRANERGQLGAAQERRPFRHPRPLLPRSQQPWSLSFGRLDLHRSLIVQQRLPEHLQAAPSPQHHQRQRL